MKTTAVICEYNPFHKGHALQIDAIKNTGNLVVCIMSGGFVQRGMPAIYDKFTRAKAAVLCGADLVLELPYPYSCSTAEFFALGGVRIADSLNIIDELWFGSECGNIEILKTTSDRLMSADFCNEMKLARADKANSNKPYAVLRETVYNRMYGDTIPLLPNDILGVEYISALQKINSKIVPVTYKREKGYSATESRKLIWENNSFDMIPSPAETVFAGADKYCMDYAERAILAFYRSASTEKLKKYEGMTDGIAEKLVKCAAESTSLAELIQMVSGKSYTNAKIRRCILHGMTGVTTEMLKRPPLYTQVLACGNEGRALIRKIQKSGGLPVITKPAHFKKLESEALGMAEFNLAAEGLLTLMCEKPKSSLDFLKQSPFIAQ